MLHGLMGDHLALHNLLLDHFWFRFAGDRGEEFSLVLLSTDLLQTGYSFIKQHPFDLVKVSRGQDHLL